jgi:hypothetical protein
MSNGNANGSGAQERGNKLEGFLLSQKQAFLGDFNAGNLKGWTVVMGNEAGGGTLFRT